MGVYGLWWFTGALILLGLFFGVGAIYRRLRKGSEDRGQEWPSKESVAAAPEVGEIEASPPQEGEAVAAASITLERALEKTKRSFLGRVKEIFAAKGTLPAQDLEELEEILYTSDLGPQTVRRLMEVLGEKLSKREMADFEVVRGALRDEVVSIFTKSDGSGGTFGGLDVSSSPVVWMVVGVNGAGKTTTIGKLAAQLAQGGKRVMVAAGDTFRAAAGEQLKVWTERAQVEIFSPEGVTDPSAVAYQAVERAKAQGFDVVMVDTAGRLHTHKNLMEELKKMKRVIAKILPEAPHEILLVLDASSGQNALVQAREFHSSLEVSGVVLTKLDGTAKGGVAVGVAYELGLPIRLIGVGEKMGDLRPFVAQEFVEAIL